MIISAKLHTSFQILSAFLLFFFVCIPNKKIYDFIDRIKVAVMLNLVLMFAFFLRQKKANAIKTKNPKRVIILHT